MLLAAPSRTRLLNLFSLAFLSCASCAWHSRRGAGGRARARASFVGQLVLPSACAAQAGGQRWRRWRRPGSLLVCYRPLAVEAARKPRIGPKRDCCSTVLHRTPQWQWPNQATTHATAGQRWRQAQTRPPPPGGRHSPGERGRRIHHTRP